MFAYLSEYKLEDMKAMMRNSSAPCSTSAASLEGKRAVLTGATSGVGRSAARELAAHGCSMILIGRHRARTEAAAEELETTFGISAAYVLADLSDLQEVRQAARQIADMTDSIDILINGAGIYSTRKQHTPEGFESVFCVNHLAPFLLTGLLIPMLKSRPSARIIQVNSQGHRFNGFNVEDLNWKRRLYTGLRGYGASKTAQLLSVWEFADRLKGTSVTINAMHPGAVRSNIGRENGPLYTLFQKKVLWRVLKDAAVSGQALHYLAADPAVEGVSGDYFNLTYREKPAPHALDREVGAVLWQKSLEMTGLSDDL